MQPKVSIIIPCYNKAKWIGNTFNSVLAQDWHNIELILVNDGSTDGTRDIITEYEQKFMARGYEVVIVDQENQGVAAAVRNGLLIMSGEYVCQIDADDEIDPKYVSTMAGWLADNPDYDWAACDCYRVTNKSASYVSLFPLGEEEDCKIEKWIMSKIQTATWFYMIRSHYLHACNVINSFSINRKGAQEAQIFLPLVLGAGKIKYFRIPLYTCSFLEPETHHSYFSNYEQAVIYIDGWAHTVDETICRLLLNENEKNRLYAILKLERVIKIIKYLLSKQNMPDILKKWNDELLYLISTYFMPGPQLKIEYTMEYLLLFCTAVQDNIIGIKPKSIKTPTGRIIAWGAQGKNAKNVLPYLINTPIEPTNLWDMEGDDNIVKKPNLSSLTTSDFILLFPSYAEDIRIMLTNSGCKNILLYSELLTYAAALIFPDFYNRNLIFKAAN